MDKLFKTITGLFQKDAGGFNVLYDNRIMSTFADDISEQALMRDYKKSLYLFAAIDTYAKVFASADIYLYQILSKTGEAEKIGSHPLLDILYRPNEHQIKTEFMRILAINLKLSGENFVRMIRAENGDILGLVNIRPDIVDVELKDKGEGPEMIYKVYNNGETFEYTNYEIVHIKIADPSNPMRGTGLLSPLITRVRAEDKASKLQEKVFSNNGQPDGILWAKGLNSKEKTLALKKSLRNTFSGANSDNRIAVISDEAKYQQLSFSQKDLQFIEGMNFLRDDIFMAVGVPKDFVTLEDTGQLSNGGDRGWNLFIKKTIRPDHELVIDNFNERLIGPNYAEPFLIDFEDLSKEDETMMLKKAEVLGEKYFTHNEVRSWFGGEPVAGADTLLTEFGKVPVGETALVIENAFAGRPALFKKVEKIEDMKRIKELALKIQKKKLLTTHSPEVKDAYWKGMNNITDGNIEKMEKRTAKFFKEQKARVKEKLDELPEGEPLNPSIIFDIVAETENTRKMAMNIFPNLAVRSGNGGLEPAKQFYTKIDDFTIDAELIALIEERALLFATQVTGVTYDVILRMVNTGITEGIGRNEIARNIFNAFDDMTRVRAKRIAQTEGTNISNLGLNHAFKQEPLITGKEWISSRDGKVRDEHVANDGQVRGKNESFPNGEAYPAHKSINCRCVIAPVIG